MTPSEENPVAEGAAVAPSVTGRRVPLWVAIVACSVPMFMVALDNLVVPTALHTLAVDLEANTQQLQPTAAVVLGSVSREHAGKASGANTTVQEIGGALGIAVLSTVFVAHGGTGSPQRFVDGLHPAVWVGVVVVFAGALCALGIPRPHRPETDSTVRTGLPAETVAEPA
ncbi:hypothetical protein ACW4TU_02085 [Streptomyces sp. QTS52]